MNTSTHTVAPLPPAVVIGASFGGVHALMELVSTMPAGLAAVVAVVLHIGDQKSILPELLTRKGPMRALHPVQGQPWTTGVIYVAPPDHHLLLRTDVLELHRGPRENHARPAIDPLFRTAALGWRERAIGVVLTGELDDGTAGLAAVKSFGGVTVVQEPTEAVAPSMPSSALAHVEIDHRLPLAQIGPLLARLVEERAALDAATNTTRPTAQVWEQEQAIFEGLDPMEKLSAIATPSQLTCPECGGALSEMKDSRPLRFRCHTGHAFTVGSLAQAQAQVGDHALQASFRALREREMLLRRLAVVAEATGDPEQAAAGRRQADRVREQAQALVRIIECEARP
jgi:two-component system chemotaxis response regulator CheB